MKYEIKIVKLGFLGKDKIDIEEFAKEGGFLYGIFDEFGVLEKNKCEENFAFFYCNKHAGHGAFFKNQINEKTKTGEVILTVNERMTKSEFYSDNFFMERMVETVKKFFHTVRIYENDKLITEEMFEEGRYFGRSQSEYEEIWKSDFYEFAENTKDGFVQGPLFPLFIDEDNLNSFQCYTNQVYPMAEYDHQYVNREYFIDDNTDKKVIRWFLEENKTAVMPTDLRTIKEHWGASAVISINGKDYPYDLTVDVMKSNYDVQNYDRRQIQHPKFSKIQLKRIAETVEKRLKTDQFPDFNFKLVVISNIVHKNPDFKEKLEDVYDYAKRYSSYSKDFIDSNVVEILKEIVLTKKDLAKVTHLCLSRENDFFFEIKPNWSGEDSLFDIESFQGIELLENLDTYFFDGELCNPNLQEKLCDFGEVFDKNDDHDKTDYAEEADEDEDEDDEEDYEEEDYGEDDDDDDENDEESYGSIPYQAPDYSDKNIAKSLLEAYNPFLDNSANSLEVRKFVKDLMKNWSEYDKADLELKNKVGVILLYVVGQELSQNNDFEQIRSKFIPYIKNNDYIKTMLGYFDAVLISISSIQEYREKYFIFNEVDFSKITVPIPSFLENSFSRIMSFVDYSYTKESIELIKRILSTLPEMHPSYIFKINKYGFIAMFFNGMYMQQDDIPTEKVWITVKKNLTEKNETFFLVEKIFEEVIANDKYLKQRYFIFGEETN